MRSRRSGSSISVSIASASFWWSPGGTVMASIPWRATCGTAVSSDVLTIGNPAAIASSCASPKVSALVTDGMTKMSATDISLTSSPSETEPNSRTRSLRPEAMDPIVQGAGVHGPRPRSRPRNAG